jgi:acetyl esterase/lipase
MASYSLESAVTAATPPTLLILTGDDTAVLPENSLRYYAALQRNGVPAELHVYGRGQHGFGIRLAQGLPVGNWPEVAWTWLTASWFLPAPGQAAALPSRDSRPSK